MRSDPMHDGIGQRDEAYEHRHVSPALIRRLIHRRSRRAATIVLAAAGTLCPAATALAQSPVRVGGAVRVGTAIHAGGLAHSLREHRGRPENQRWRHRIEPAMAYGATLSVGLPSGLAGVRFDGDLVPSADIRRDPKGPPLYNPTDGGSSWLSASIWTAPTWLCRDRCVLLSLGAGKGTYDYAVGELRGDIMTALAVRQTVSTGRIGVESQLPWLGRRFVVSAVDHFGTLETFYSGEQLSTLHTLVVSGGIRLGR